MVETQKVHPSRPLPECERYRTECAARLATFEQWRKDHQIAAGERESRLTREIAATEERCNAQIKTQRDKIMTLETLAQANQGKVMKVVGVLVGISAMSGVVSGLLVVWATHILSKL